MGCVEDRFEIDCEQFFPSLFVALDERLESIPTLTVDKNVDLTEAYENLAYHAIDIDFFSKIHLAGQSVHAEVLNRAADFLSIVFDDICYRGLCAFVCQGKRDGAADSSSASCYQSGFSLKLHDAALASSPNTAVFLSSRIFSRRRNASRAAPKAPTSSGSALTFTFLLSVSSSAFTIPFCRATP